jgi:hypothetical protein
MYGHFKRLPVTTGPSLPFVGAEHCRAVLAVDDSRIGRPNTTADFMRAVYRGKNFRVTLKRNWLCSLGSN